MKKFSEKGTSLAVSSARELDPFPDALFSPDRGRVEYVEMAHSSLKHFAASALLQSYPVLKVIEGIHAQEI
jgi:hypothetical protein